MWQRHRCWSDCEKDPCRYSGEKEQVFDTMPQLTCTLPEIGGWKTGFLWTLLVLRIYVYLRDGTVILDHAKNKGIEIEPHKLVWSHTECQQEVKPWNIFERCFFWHKQVGLSKAELFLTESLVIYCNQYINLGELRSKKWFECVSLVINWFQTNPYLPQWAITHRIHGAAIYGNMDPINIPPLC
jgi:hypothetical protein